MLLAHRGHPRTPFAASRMRTGEESERGGEEAGGEETRRREEDAMG
jgi:hypothetical protein